MGESLPFPPGHLERFLERAALERLRFVLPVLMFGIVASLIASIPSKVPLPPPVLAINAGVLAIAVALFVLVRRDRIPLTWGTKSSH